MYFHPSVRIVFLSFILGILVLFIFMVFNRPESGEAYCVLAVDDALPDRSIGGLLKTAGFDGYYSESTTTVYFDDFGRPKGFFLDQYRDEMEPFDPRDDGYAEKLRSFFVYGGKRYFFIPLGKNAQYKLITKDMDAALGNIPFSLRILAPSRPILVWLVFQFAAMTLAMLISRDRRRFALQIPIILAFAWEGAAGLIMAGLLAGIWELLREPLAELFNSRPYGDFRERFEPYRRSLYWSLFFGFLFLILSLVWNVSRAPVWLGFLSFLLLELLSFPYGRIRGRSLYFTPVLIITKPRQPYYFRFSTMVFAIASLLVLLLFLFFPGFSPELTLNPIRPGSFGISGSLNFSGSSGSLEPYMDFAHFPLLSEYEERMAFQSSFSVAPLNTPNDENIHKEYLQYLLGEDGLISGTKDSLSAWEIPAFPLEKLTDFLLDYMNKKLDTPQPRLKDWVIVSLILICCIPNVQIGERRRSKKNKMPLVRDRRIAA